MYDKYFVGTWKRDLFDNSKPGYNQRIYDDIMTTNSESEAWEFAIKENGKGYFVEVGELMDDDDVNSKIYDPYELTKQPELKRESKRRTTKLRIAEGKNKYYGQTQNGEDIDESTVSELYRIAEYEVLPKTKLADMGEVTIDEDSFEYFATGTAWGAYLKYDMYFTISQQIDETYPLDLINYIRQVDSLTYHVGSVIEIQFKIKVNTDNCDTRIESIDVYSPDSRYNEWDTNNFRKRLDYEEICDDINPIANEAAEEIHRQLSNL